MIIGFGTFDTTFVFQYFRRSPNRSSKFIPGIAFCHARRHNWMTSSSSSAVYGRSCVMFSHAHSTVKCNGQTSGAEEKSREGFGSQYLSGARVEFVLDPLDIGIGQNREVGTFWEVLPEEAVSVFVEAAPTSDKACQNRIVPPARLRFGRERRTLFHCRK